MAIPFNMPEDHNEVEVIITQLQYLLTKLQAALRRSRATNAQTRLSSHNSNTRVRTNSSNRSRVTEGLPSSSSSSESPSSNLPDLLNSLAWLAAASQDAIDTPQITPTSIRILRPMRIRTTSESSCCDENKLTETNSVGPGNVQEWNQVGGNTSKLAGEFAAIIDPEETDEQSSESVSNKDYSREGILSKIVPGPVSAPFWTAMICFVGWQIFRAR
ncbi:uncharacterized protein LOC130898211 isoform X1 [Diorhabda carinulata]|uniref:uncharacterized protein LOC130450827 isoform X1 n=1 Tax=Diorhabda sublineata TaxID=1163346 RepID=UPI0024E096B3|nr:uncharacterized protein LOC130450827 isoform X1 [Diorhabda sublineata]XP_057663301.1 uncharacterized protein LOC130898211 isoform X1 [Diorhabda carinulata]